MHHAYLIVGQVESSESHVRELLSGYDFSTTGNPDYLVLREDTFGIDEARLLSERAALKAFTGRKVFLLTPHRITLEAQNALLKTFEEPVGNTHFFLVVSEEGSIIPTLRSRMQLIRTSPPNPSPNLGEGGPLAVGEVESFLNSPLKDRLEFAKNFEGDLTGFLDTLLTHFRGQEVVSKIYNLRRFASDRSASSRLVLEHLALII